MTAIATRDLEVPSPDDLVDPAGYAAEVENASLSYGDNLVLRDVTLRVGAHEIVALIGRSGSGKSTLLRLLAGLSQTESGSVRTAGHPAVSFQEPRLLAHRLTERRLRPRAREGRQVTGPRTRAPHPRRGRPERQDGCVARATLG